MIWLEIVLKLVGNVSDFFVVYILKATPAYINVLGIIG